MHPWPYHTISIFSRSSSSMPPLELNLGVFNRGTLPGASPSISPLLAYGAMVLTADEPILAQGHRIVPRTCSIPLLEVMHVHMFGGRAPRDVAWHYLFIAPLRAPHRRRLSSAPGRESRKQLCTIDTFRRLCLAIVGNANITIPEQTRHSPVSDPKIYDAPLLVRIFFLKKSLT